MTSFTLATAVAVKVTGGFLTSGWIGLLTSGTVVVAIRISLKIENLIDYSRRLICDESITYSFRCQVQTEGASGKRMRST
jgi:hypothetical protein